MFSALGYDATVCEEDNKVGSLKFKGRVIVGSILVGGG